MSLPPSTVVKEWRDIVNPATQDVVGRVPFATKDEVDAAVDPTLSMPRILEKIAALVRPGALI